MLSGYSKYILIAIAIIALLIVIKIMYTKVLQNSAKFKQGMGKISTFFAKLFGISPIIAVYADFYQSLSLSKKIKLRSARKYIYLDFDIKAENEFGIDLNYKNGNLICSIHPTQLLEAKVAEEDIIRFLAKVLKGKLNLTVINISLKDANADNKIDDIKAIGKCFKYIAAYLSSEVNYVLNIKGRRHCIGHEQWDEYSKRYNIADFWVNKKPTHEWVTEVVTNPLHYNFSFISQTMDTEVLKKLYVFLDTCVKTKTFLNAVIEYTQLRSARYKGFGIGIIENNNLYSKVKIASCYRKYRFGLKIRNLGLGLVMLGVSGGLIASIINLKNKIPETVNALVVNSSNNLVNPDTITLQNYLLSKKQINQNDLNILTRSIYMDKRINYISDTVWATIIKDSIINPCLAVDHDPIQLYALQLLLDHNSTKHVNSLLSSNIWLWSKVTQIPVAVLKVWLKVSYASKADSSTINKPGKLTLLEDKNTVIKEVNKTLNSVSYKYLDIQAPLKASFVKSAIDITYLNQVMQESTKLGLDHSKGNLLAKKIADRYKYILSYSQFEDMSRFMLLLKVRDDLTQIEQAADINTLVNDFNHLNQQIKTFPKKDWATVLMNRLLAQVKTIIIQKNIKKIYAEVPSRTYYSKSFYEKSISPLYKQMLGVFKTYQGDGVNVEGLSRKAKDIFVTYGVEYQHYYKTNLSNAVSLNIKNTNLFISELESMTGSAALANVVTSIQKNIVSLPKKLDPYMATVPLSFEGINNFAKNRQKYDGLLKLYADELKEALPDPQKLTSFYISKDNNFHVSMNVLLDTFKLSKDIKSILIKPALEAEQIGFAPVQKYARQYWNINLKPLYKDMFLYFPFAKDSKKTITVAKLTEIIGKDGLFWQRYKPVIGQLRANYPKHQWLTQDQINFYQTINKLHQSFWDEKGKQKELVFDIETTGKLPSYNTTKEGWFGSKSTTLTAYIGALSSGKSKVSDIGINGINYNFKVKWWLPGSTSVVLIGKDDAIAHAITTNGMWSFWKILADANWKDNILSWSFNNGSTQVNFKFPNASVWAGLGYQNKPGDADVS